MTASPIALAVAIADETLADDLAQEGFSVDTGGERCGPFAAKATRPSGFALAGLQLSPAKQHDTDAGAATNKLHQGFAACRSAPPVWYLFGILIAVQPTGWLENCNGALVDLSGIEPLTSAMRSSVSGACA